MNFMSRVGKIWSRLVKISTKSCQPPPKEISGHVPTCARYVSCEFQVCISISRFGCKMMISQLVSQDKALLVCSRIALGKFQEVILFFNQLQIKAQALYDRLYVCFFG